MSTLTQNVETAPAELTKPQKRNANLDMLRGIAILMVLGRHYDYFTLWHKIGWAGVDLFFVLSGFLISGLLFKEWTVTGQIDIKRFYIRRGFKIYPSFYALIALTIVADAIWPHLTPYALTRRSLLAELFFIQNYFRGIWSHTWSLGVEEHFYLVLPLVLWIMYRRRTIDPFRAIPTIFFISAIADFFLRCRAQASGLEISLFATQLRIDALLFGVLLSYYRWFHWEIFARISRSCAGLVVPALAVLLLCIAPFGSAIMDTAGFTLNFLGFGLLLTRVIDLPSPVLLSPLAMIGRYSYSIYLWHVWVSRIVPHHSQICFWLYVMLSLAVGIATAKLVEYPALTLRDRVFPTITTTSDKGPRATTAYA